VEADNCLASSSNLPPLCSNSRSDHGKVAAQAGILLFLQLRHLCQFILADNIVPIRIGLQRQCEIEYSWYRYECLLVLG